MVLRGKVAAGALGLIVVSALAYYASIKRQPAAKPLDGPRYPILVAGVNEPEELAVEPTPLPVLTPAEQMFADELRKPAPPNAKPDTLALINPVLKSYPEYGDGHAMRMESLCYVAGTKPASILSEINSAIAYHAKPETAPLGELLSVRARLEFAGGNAASAMTDLENGMKSDLDSAAQMFNNGNVKPGEMPSSQCKWTEAEINGLVAKTPGDYRAYLFRGLFYTFFAQYDPPSLTPALENFQKAIDLNSQSALPHYFMAEAYLHGNFWKRLGSETLRAAQDKTIIPELDHAITLDPKLAPALASRAELYLEAKQYAAAVPDFDRVLGIEPDNTTALHDRALAKLELGDASEAARGFTHAIDKMKPGKGRANAYENRADAYSRSHQYDQAIDDLTKAIAYQLSATLYVMSLKQFRTVFPEYAPASDEAVARKLNQTFFPQYKYEDFAKTFIDPSKEPFETFLLELLYVKRAEAYLMASRYRNASTDYKRAVSSYANHGDSVERWHAIQIGTTATFSIDLKSADFSRSDSMKLWIKQTKGSADDGGPYSLNQYEINCGSRQIKTASIASYDKSGNLVGSRQGDRWESVIPDTLGETISNGMCAPGR